jgi:O-acetyl-ADP-ribose deacetylase (regulator of RNase III)
MKSKIEIKKIDITDLNVDAIVNAANRYLQEGGGVCGAIFSKAGASELADACSDIGGCETGNAVITPGFDLLARYIIHAVGPIWNGGDSNEEELLYNAYKHSLTLAKENNCHSIGFPLISSGIYGYPKKEAWKIAIRSCSDFIEDNPDYTIGIVFAVLSDESKELGENVLAG